MVMVFAACPVDVPRLLQWFGVLVRNENSWPHPWPASREPHPLAPGESDEAQVPDLLGSWLLGNRVH